MFAVGRLKVAAAGVAGSWLLVMTAEAALAFLAPAQLVVAALALGTTIGQTAVAIPMVIATRRICGRDSVAGVVRANLSGLAAGAAGAAIGVGVCLAMPVAGKLMAFGVAVLAACGAVAAFGAVAYALDRSDLRVIATQLRRVLGKPARPS